jgi:hypothetical protein
MRDDVTAERSAHMIARKKFAIVAGAAIVLGAAGAVAYPLVMPTHESQVVSAPGPGSPDLPEPGDSPD